MIDILQLAAADIVTAKCNLITLIVQNFTEKNNRASAL